MPSSPGKRSLRARRELRSDASVGQPDDSSPSRPSKRRKKAEDVAETPAEPAEEGSSSLVADQSANNADDDDDAVVSQVVQHLLTPLKQTIQASKDHSNAKHETNKEGVKAYAKIACQDWTYYITTLIVNIGRTSDPSQQQHMSEADDSFVHIDLGPSKLISRNHARIFFRSGDEKWVLEVKGRNNLKVDGMQWNAGHSDVLNSGAVIEIGGVEMMFVLPTELGSLHIDDIYLIRAGLLKPEQSERFRQTRHPLPAGDVSALRSSPHGGLPRVPGFQKPLAPAPPDYKRPGTPPSVRGRPLSQHRSPHVDSTGPIPMLMNASDVDLSLDDNRHIKPQYSYAQMITQAIMNTGENKLNLNGIYNFIMDNYSYYRHQQAAGWQNSIRHNLSLNKAFEKVARSTDEPGKGMKWQIVADVRDEMMRHAYRGGRGGHRGSSNPSSPNQLNYITQGPREMAAREPGSSKKRKVSPSGSPQPRASLPDTQQTPVRNSRKPLPDEAGVGADGSPLPRLRKPNASSTLGGSDNAPASPTLTSSYTQEDGASFVTPAPHRVHPRLAPPSTAQRPSQHMPTSSPAPFWRYADIGSTPLKPAQFDLSPSKALENLPQSSSPPPAPSKSPATSPTRTSHPEQSSHGSQLKQEQSQPTQSQPSQQSASQIAPAMPELEEEGGFDLTKGFQSIGSYHAPAGLGHSVKPAVNGNDSRVNLST